MPKPINWNLEEPEDPEGYEGKLREVIELYERAAEERKTTREPEYWQGRKDGLRAALAILEIGEDGEIWDRLNSSSHGFRLEEKEGLLKFLEDIRFNTGAALNDYAERKDRRIHPQTLINILQWIDSYDRKAKKDELLPAVGAITPDPRKVTETR